MKVLTQDTSWYKHPTFVVPFIIICGFMISIIVSGVWWQTAYANTIADHIFIDSIPVGGLTKDQAMNLLYEQYQPSDFKITLESGQFSQTTTSKQLGIFKPYQIAVDNAYQIGRSQSLLRNIQELSQLIFHQKKFTVNETYDTNMVVDFVRQLASVSDSNGTYPSATLDSQGAVTIIQGKEGIQINIPQTVENIQNATKNQNIELKATITTTGKVLSDAELEEAQHRAQRYGSKKISFTNESLSYKLSTQDLLSTLAFPQGFQYQKIDSITSDIDAYFTISPQNAEFEIDKATLKVSKFKPEVVGIKLQKEDFSKQLIDLLQRVPDIEEDDVSQTVPLTKFLPEITLASLNDLGINEEIGFGESFYDHSIPSRIHNVSTANAIVNNIVVAPGKEFSFNKALGEVSQKTGFQQAYVIRSGATVLGDGGGVCQVSTTLFRALLDAGLNITKRKSHSYRVSYYEIDNEPGYDATVYAGDVDLRFINDTGHHILITFHDDPQSKYMNVHIYGTNDGRTSQISNYQKWGYQNPPPPQYIDDPTLPSGKTVQIDWAVAGIKAKFTHTVKDKDGKVLYENEYYSNYIPWSAKYRSGTGV